MRDSPSPSSLRHRWWSREDLFLLVLFGAFFFLPCLGQIPLFDKDEPRFATAAREMYVDHDFFVPRFNGDLRPDKPPFVYWLMNGVHAFTGEWNELTARLPSAICSTLTLLVVYLMVGARFGRLTGLMASLMLGSCALFIVESRLATADATMLLFIITCMACAWSAWDAGDTRENPTEEDGPRRHLPRTDYLLDRGHSEARPVVLLDHFTPASARHVPWTIAILFWVSLACGTLTKGVPLLFVFVPMAALSIATGSLPVELRRWRSHLHVTRVRISIAAILAAIVIGVFITSIKVHSLIEGRWWAAALGGLFIAMALTPGLPGVLYRCSVKGNWRWWKHLRPAVGVPLLVTLVAAWVVPVAIRAPQLLEQMVGIHFLQRVAGPLLKAFHISFGTLNPVGGNNSMESYAEPSGFYLALVWATFWPWSVLLVPAAYHAIRRMLGKTALAIDPRPYQFLVAWVVPMWVLLEIARGKLLHYPLPTYVAISILCADALVQSWHRLTDVMAAAWLRAARWVILAIWCILGVAVVIAGQRYLDPSLFPRCVLFGGVLIAGGVAATLAWGRPSWPFVTVLGWGGALLIASTLILPDVAPLRLSKLAGANMAEIVAAEPDFQLAAVGYDAPTLVYYAGQHVKMFDGPDQVAQVAEMLADGKWLVAVDDGVLSSLQQRFPNLRIYLLRRYEGVNAGNLRWMRVTLITNTLPREDVVIRPTTISAVKSLPSTMPTSAPTGSVH